MAVVALFMCALNLHAQISLLATLNHEGEISTFYGAGALQQAHAAAAHGDVITLSSGQFTATNITKAVTVRGAGMVVDTIAHTEPTRISGSFTINVSDTLSHRFSMEGIYHSENITVNCLKNAMFTKCRLYGVTTTTNTNSIMKDVTFIHCRIVNEISFPGNGSASFLGCILFDGGMTQYGSTVTSAKLSFTNCLMKDASMYNSEYKNCIIEISSVNGYVKVPVPSYSTYYNNLFIYNTSIDTGIGSITNLKVSTSDSRIKNLLGSYSDYKDYKLTEEAKAMIKGADGTEVGIYGGNLPYSPTPSNPQITKFNVASKSTADGKLSVDIEVSSAE